MSTLDKNSNALHGGLAQATAEEMKSCVDKGAKALDAVTKKASAIGRSADGYVRDNPWIAIGAAAGVGIMLGLLLRGRRRS